MAWQADDPEEAGSKLSTCKNMMDFRGHMMDIVGECKELSITRQQVLPVKFLESIALRYLDPLRRIFQKAEEGELPLLDEVLY